MPELRERTGREAAAAICRTKLLDSSRSPALQQGNPVKSRLAAAFHNTGNLLFTTALRQHIPYAEPVCEWSEMTEDCDTILLSMANFINPFTDVSVETETLARSTAERIVLIGCGAQAAAYDDWFDLRPDTATFLRIVSERSTAIGVRGHYTAELLRRHGFSNTRVIGCPAFFMSGLLPPEIRSKPADRIAVGATPTGDQRDHIRRLFSFALRNDAAYVLQSEDHLLGLFDDDDPSQETLEFFRHYYCPDDSNPGVFTDWLRRRATFFFDTSAWLDSLRSTDLYIGTRIHGSMAAIQAGCPALTLVHDTRTRELCAHFRLPCMELSEFDPGAPVEHYRRLARLEDFQACYPLRAVQYGSFLSENGIESPIFDAGSLPDLQICGTGLESVVDLDALDIGRSTQVRMAIQRAADLSSDLSVPATEARTIGDRAPSPASAIPTCEHPSAVALEHLQNQVLTKARSLASAVSAFTHSTGRNPEFILGYDNQPVAISPSKLAAGRILSDRNQIIQNMPDEGAVAELGTQTGAFAGHILKTCPNVTLYTVDIDYSRFKLEALQPFLLSGRLHTIKGLSWSEIESFPEEFFSWIYVDASHFIDHVRMDLNAAKTRVKLGGYIICNDYTVWSPFEAQPYGVLQAVNEFLATEAFDVSYFALHPFGYHDIAMCRRG